MGLEAGDELAAAGCVKSEMLHQASQPWYNYYRQANIKIVKRLLIIMAAQKCSKCGEMAVTIIKEKTIGPEAVWFLYKCSACGDQYEDVFD